MLFKNLFQKSKNKPDILTIATCEHLKVHQKTGVYSIENIFSEVNKQPSIYPVLKDFVLVIVFGKNKKPKMEVEVKIFSPSGGELVVLKKQTAEYQPDKTDRFLFGHTFKGVNISIVGFYKVEVLVDGSRYDIDFGFYVRDLEQVDIREQTLQDLVKTHFNDKVK